MRTVIIGFLAAALTWAADGAVLWRDPGPLESLDLAGGPGGRDKAPQPPFTFSEEEKGGTTPKIIVTDSRGVKWTVKFGEEVKAENFASRIAWAAGYFSDPTYFVREAQLDGVGSVGRAARFIQNGRIENARFELRDNMTVHYIPKSSWDLDEASLKGTKELSGLKVLFILLSNWDVKPQNLAQVELGGQRYYAVTDWGASMGRAADATGASKWNCSNYSKDSKSFIEGPQNGFMVFNYDGKKSAQVTNGIRVEHVKWLMSRLGKLSDAQIDAALDASGATPEEKACFGKAFRSRLGQLMTIAEAEAPLDSSQQIRTRTVTKTTTTTKEVPQQ